MTQRGSTWQAALGNRPVLWMSNEPGTVSVEGRDDEEPNPFATVVILDPAEAPRVRALLKRSRHFRDFVQNLDAAGYAVSAAPPR